MVQLNPTADPPALLLEWLRSDAAPDAIPWLVGQLQSLGEGPGSQKLSIAMGLAARRFAKSEKLGLDVNDLVAANDARPGWDPRGWSLADAARILLLVEISRREADFRGLFRDLCRTADVSEASPSIAACRFMTGPASWKPRPPRARAPTCKASLRRWPTAIRIRASSSTSSAGTT
jgi:hypothetical protein